MAGNHNRHAIRRAGAGYGARRLGIAQLARQLAVAAASRRAEFCAAPATPSIETPSRAGQSICNAADCCCQLFLSFLPATTRSAASTIAWQATDRASVSRRETPRAGWPRPLPLSRPATASKAARSVAPTITQPKGVRAEHQPICSPRPPAAKRAGVMPSCAPVIAAARRTESGVVDCVGHGLSLLERLAQRGLRAMLADIAAGSRPSSL
jgi:hypothetical protein